MIAEAQTKLEITPYITFKGNCLEAIEFYKNALGAPKHPFKPLANRRLSVVVG